MTSAQPVYIVMDCEEGAPFNGYNTFWTKWPDYDTYLERVLEDLAPGESVTIKFTIRTQEDFNAAEVEFDA